MEERIRTERRGRVVVARLDHPPHALMDERMVRELDALVRETDADDGVGAVVLTGAHPERFLAHYDVAELLESARSSPAVSERQARVALGVADGLRRLPGGEKALARTPAAGLGEVEAFHDTLSRMGRSGTAWIAAINGATAGGGLELALACDLRFLSDRGELAQPEVLLGFPPGGGGTQRLARLIGRARALELMLLGRAISPAEAERLGLVTAVVPHARVLDAAVETAERLATRFKPAVSAIKRAVLEGGSRPLDEGLRAEQSAFLALLGRPEVIAAMEAYVAHIERTGELPAADPEARERLELGSFHPFHDASGSAS